MYFSIKVKEITAVSRIAPIAIQIRVLYPGYVIASDSNNDSKKNTAPVTIAMLLNEGRSLYEY
ncbi:MAG TPA: hypothetical protein VFX73_13590, partial [Chitinophagaceae bacterium]|nr:hypothetical protein [Chitinophagaceae bacterium]